MRKDLFENWRRFLREMYYFDPEYPDTNIKAMSDNDVSLDMFDFQFEKSLQKEKAFNEKTKYLLIPAENKEYLIFKKGEYDPFVDFLAKANMKDAKQKFAVDEENSLVVNMKL